MNEKDLKKVIKQLVRESLTEIFAEMHLESIVEGVIRKRTRPVKQKSFSSTLQEQVGAIENTEKAQPVQSKEELRRVIREKIGVTDTAWEDIYADTITSGNSVLQDRSVDAPDSEHPELVTEEVLRANGMLKDYSRFVQFKTDK